MPPTSMKSKCAVFLFSSLFLMMFRRRYCDEAVTKVFVTKRATFSLSVPCMTHRTQSCVGNLNVAIIISVPVKWKDGHGGAGIAILDNAGVMITDIPNFNIGKIIYVYLLLVQSILFFNFFLISKKINTKNSLTTCRSIIVQYYIFLFTKYATSVTYKNKYVGTRMILLLEEVHKSV